MIEVAPSSPVSGSKRVYYDYDHLGRRVQRVVYSWIPTGGGSGAWNTTADECQRTVYYNWLPLIELDGPNSNAVLRRWTWDHSSQQKRILSRGVSHDAPKLYGDNGVNSGKWVHTVYEG